MPYIVLRGHRCNVIVLNVHAPSDEKSDDSKNSFYEELQQVFTHAMQMVFQLLTVAIRPAPYFLRLSFYF
jgi:hypothetical protein